MITKNEKKLIRSLKTKKGRESSGLCLVEGEKVIEAAGKAIQLTFEADVVGHVLFGELVTTDTPQSVAATAKIPEWSDEDVANKKTIVLLDGVQDPGNVGAILRLCLGFDASLVLVESADVASPKVVRSSVGAMFHVPWKKIGRAKVKGYLKSLDRPVYRLEKSSGARPVSLLKTNTPIVLIVGSEGSGIKLETEGKSVFVDHSDSLESLNVANATAIALYARNN
jgi:RNA methyltransferase, TrmH family